MKILALDLGDVWTGTAISDSLLLFCKPFQTIKTKSLKYLLKKILQEHPISKVIVGLPKTLQNKESEQTKKIRSQKEQIEKMFPEIEWILWDERLTSKQAQKIQRKKDDKQKIHSIAAALILESYLMHLQIQKEKQSIE